MLITNTKLGTTILNSLRGLKRQTIESAKRFSVLGAEPNINLIIIGAQKGGTTALYNYLSEHPYIDVPGTKELNFFNSCNPSKPSRDEYLRQFPKRFRWNPPFYSIDTSPSYLIDAKQVARKIHAFDPNIKIAAVLREPISRAISSWFMYKKLASQNPDWFINSSWVASNELIEIKRRSRFGEDFESDIAEEIEALESGYRIEYPIVEYGLYAQQLTHYFKIFDDKNIKVIFSEQLKLHTQSTLNSLFEFSGIPSYQLAQEKLVPHFVGDNKIDISAQKQNALHDYYRIPNQELANLLNLELPWSDRF